MRASEWLEIAAGIRERYPAAQLPEETVRRWGEDLQDLDAVHVQAGVEALYRQGRTWPPNSGEIRAAVASLMLDAPDWHEVLTLLRAVCAQPREAIASSEVRPDANGADVAHVTMRYPRDEAIAALPELVRAFVESIEFSQIEIGASRNAQGADEARLRDKWLAFEKRAQREVLLVGIPAGGLATLKRIEERAGLTSIGEAARRVRGELAA